MELHVTGWRHGLLGVRLVHLLRDDFEMSIGVGKAVLDQIMDRSDFGDVRAAGVPGADEVRLTEPVTVAIPPGLAASEAKSKLEGLGLVIGPSTTSTQPLKPEE